MKTFGLALMAATMMASAASAATITYGGLAAPGGGYTTALTGPGVTVETFNGTTGGCGLTGGMGVSGNYHLVVGSQVSYYAAPAGDGTCYASVPMTGGNGSAFFDVSPLVVGPNGGRISQLGLYWGSIDYYNFIRFYNGANLVTEVRGQDVLASYGIPGNQSASGSNRYVNIHLSPTEIFDRIEFRSDGVAFEFDNVAFKVERTAVPEPASLAVLVGGLGLVALGRKRRRTAI